MHDCWMMTGHCACFDHLNCENWKTGCGNCPAIREYPQTLFFDRTREQFVRKRKAIEKAERAVYVAPSEWLMRLAKQSYLGGGDIRVIHNGIDISIFRPKSGNLAEKYNLKGKKVVLSVANLYEERKGSELIFKLPALLPDDYAVVLIGTIPTDAASRVSPKCILISRTENVEELVEWYTIADVFINPTLTDNFPTVNLEALACGTPVGSPEAVDEESGRVGEKGDEAAFVKAVIEMAETGNSLACRNRALQLYDKNDTYQKYESLLREMTGTMEDKYGGTKLAKNR